MQRLLILLLFLVGAPASAGLDDVTRAREALERGEVMPLADILGHAQRELDARVIEVEFEQKLAGLAARLDLAVPGNGLGLAIATEIAEAAGGGVALANTGRGLRVALTLPAVPRNLTAG